MPKSKIIDEKQDSSKNFFKSYEYMQNKRSLSILQRCSIFPIIMLLFRFLHIFPNISYLFATILLVVWPITLLIVKYFLRKNPYSSVIKYVLTILVEMACFIMATTKGFKVYIVYLIAPLFSCLYLDKKFSIRVTICCYFFMVLSLLIRAFKINPEMGYTAEPIVWARQMISTLTIGYLLNGVIIYVIGRRNQSLIDKDYEEVQKNLNSQNVLVSSYVALICKKGEHIEGHLKRTSKYVQIIVNCMRSKKKYSNIIDNTYAYQIMSGAFLHDIGIISVPETILNNPGELTEEERTLLHMHPEMGEKLLRENMKFVDPDYLSLVSDVVLYHHENFDGTGYPIGLKSSEIPLSARIMAVANTLDNLLQDQPWRRGMDFDKVMDEILQMAGKQLDPEIVEIVFERKESIKYAYDDFVNKGI